MTHLMRWLSQAAASLLLCSLPALAMPDQRTDDLIARLTALQDSLAGGISPEVPARTLIEAAGLLDLLGAQETAGRTEQADWAQPATGQAELQRLNMRLALTMLSQAYGPEDNAAILAAQTEPDLNALVIRNGTVTLPEVRRALQDFRLQRATDGGPLILKVPLVIWAGARLKLSPADALLLSRSDGAFVVNFGHLDVQGASIGVTGESNPASPRFMPFVTTADSGTVRMQGGRISGMGFGETLKYSGFSIMQGSLRNGGDANWIENSTFEGLITVSVNAASYVTFYANQFRDMRGPSLVVSRSIGAQVLSNLFTGGMPTNAIVLEDGSANGRVSGNVILGGERIGIVVRNASTGAQVSNNIVWNRDGGGITISDSDCGQISDNLLIDNDQKGIEVRTSQEAQISRNTILSNHSAAVWVSAQPADAQTYLTANRIAENGSGVAGAVGGNIVMDGNDFSGQFQQFLSGDLALQSPHIARNMRGETPFVLTSGGLGAPAVASQLCSD